ncbi:MAG: tetratricopeptide repeat protein [Sphingomonadales bacterium]|jgi:tetratricopeptide (TPR) repeat protein
MLNFIQYSIYVNLAVGLIFSTTVFVNAQEEIDSDNERYLNCVSLALDTPRLAEEIGTSWKNSGGGFPARHCISLANANMGFYEKAAYEFEAISNEIVVQEFKGVTTPLSGDIKGLRIELLAQAGNSWLLANKPKLANQAFSKALLEFFGAPIVKVELLIDRSRSFALLNDFDSAIKDLDEAQLEAPQRADIFVLRSSAKRLLKKYDEAFIDVELALFREPENRDGLLERGNLRSLKGNIEGAIEDWEYLIYLYPNTTSAELATKNLENLRVEEDFKISQKKNK